MPSWTSCSCRRSNGRGGRTGYCTPADPDAVVAALRSCASLLGDATTLAASRLGTDLRSGLADATLRRLADLAA